MSTVPWQIPGEGEGGGLWAWIKCHPVPIFLLVAVLTYGTAACVFASGIYLLQPTQDIWQHLAALRALIADPINPQNPFVATSEGSRHFHPQWLLVALAAKAIGLSAWQAIGLAGFANAAILTAGIFVFGRAFYRNPWGPFALLAAMVFSWLIPVHYTGFHSWTAFSKGGGYPALLLIGLSLLHAGLMIRSVEGDRRSLVWLAPLTALMFATHQLGTVIGLIFSGAILVAWPDGSLRQRAITAGSVALGLALSALWPYQSPFDAVRRAGNPTWTGSHNFYSLHYLTASLHPSIVGLLGILRPPAGGTHRPVLLALLAYLVAFALVPFGILIGERFLMPAVLMLHIGVATVLLRWFSGPLSSWGRPLKIFVAAAGAIAAIHALQMVEFTRNAFKLIAKGDTVSQEAIDLTADIPDGQPVAAYDVAAWPVVASGQRVLSVPWPEPMIEDLAARQARTEQLFRPGLLKQDRLRLARAAGIRTLILDERYAWNREEHPALVWELERQAAAVQKRGPLIRVDLWPLEGK